VDKLRLGDTTKLLLRAFYDVYNKLGYGFLERVYENSMAIAARKLGVRVVQQAPIRIHFGGELVGEYAADLLANDSVIVELKAVRVLAEEHEAQLLNYLKATPYEVGLLLNFGPEPEYRRRILDNNRKGSFSWLEKRDTDFHGSPRI
jgi:GxxExxY protein